MELVIHNLNQIDEVADLFLAAIGQNKVLAFKGSMGAGKTTFIKSICKKLNVIDQVNSPTFAIINEYETNVNTKVYHFDFYRIKNLEEAYDFGYEDYFYSGNFCLIEWPELVEPLLPDNTLEISICVNPDNTRTVSF